MGETDGEGIGFIGFWIMEKTEEGAGHKCDLFFAGASFSGGCFFNEFGWVLVDDEACPGGNEKGNAACASEDDGGAGILHIDD